MAGEEGVTAAELMRSLQEFKTDVREDFKELRSSIANLNHVHVDVYAADRMTDAERYKAIIQRVDAMEDGNQWLRRLVVGAAVTAVIAVVIGALVASAGIGR